MYYVEPQIHRWSARSATQVKALQQRLQNINDALVKAQIMLVQTVTDSTVHIPPPTPAPKNRYQTETLRAKLEMACNNFHLRSAASEIIAASLTGRQKGLNQPNPAKGPGVQPVVDAVAAGLFNDGNVTFQDAQNSVLRALTSKGGIKANNVHCALASMYGELSKHHHSGVSEALVLRKGEQTLEEAIGTMSVILFARRLYASDFDAVFYDSKGNPQATLSKL
ncbi:hypothetical protein DFH07DRAFT_771130 [Mycena maculata]|uniref:Uncharacterized protein n=1 Tax=Mycena maculata TaxID=230809 RepID=A0AAD7NIV9_9AGAR|nr:hypothetical protein DFH07DRAFT_771130 [Mycena maculata]